MRRMLLAALVAIVALAGTALAQQEPLGDIARKHRQAKAKAPGARVITNENLPKTAPAETAAEAPAANAETAEPSAAAAPAESAPAAEAPAQTPEDRAKLEAEWRGRVNEVKRGVSQLERELDVLERENKLRMAVFYADAGTRLRDDRKFADDSRKYESDIAAKRTELEAARARLEDLREQLRKAGLPSAWGE